MLNLNIKPMKNFKYIIPALVVIGMISIAQTKKQENVSPASPGGIDGKIIVTDKEVVKAPVMDSNLRLKAVKSVRLSKETKIGKEGDLLLIIEGGGFLATSLNPVVVIGDITIDETIISNDFEKLYVVIDKAKMEKLKRTGFKQLEVRNPGKGKASIEYNLEIMNKSVKDRTSVALLYTKEGIVVK